MVPRYYFNLVRQRTVIADHDGVEIPGEVSELEILRIMQEIRTEEPELFAGSGGWSIEVVDEQGRIVAKVSL